MEINKLIFTRIVSLRNRFYEKQSDFVQEFNKYLEEKNQLIKEKRLTNNTYTTIENKLSTKSDNLIAIINFYADKHDINPSWIMSYNNDLITKLNISNDEFKKVIKYKEVISIINKMTSDIIDNEK